MLLPVFASTALFTPLHVEASRVTGSILLLPVGGIGFDLTLTGSTLAGTIQPGTQAVPVTFSRLPAPGSDVVGSWVTTAVQGAPAGESYLDTLVLRADGRASLSTSWSAPAGSCSAQGVRGFIHRGGAWSVVRWTWPASAPLCTQLRLTDSLQLVGEMLIRTRSSLGSVVTETLVRP
jgi:hypothetical protein